MIPFIAFFYTAGVVWFFIFLQIFALGYTPPDLHIGMIIIPHQMYVLSLLIISVLIQERLMRVRRRSNAWHSDAIDHVLSFGTLIAFGGAVFLLFTSVRRPDSLSELSVIQQIIVTFAPYYVYDAIVNGVLGHQVDEGLRKTLGQGAAPVAGSGAVVPTGTNVTMSVDPNAAPFQAGFGLQLSPANERVIVDSVVTALARTQAMPLNLFQVHGRGY